MSGFVKQKKRLPKKEVQLKEVGLQFFSSLVKVINYDDKESLESPLRLVIDLLKKIPVLKLFSDWSPPTVEPVKQLPLNPAEAFASVANGANVPSKAVKEDGFWGTPKNPGSTSWGIALAEPSTIIGVSFKWRTEGKDVHAPAKIRLQSSSDGRRYTDCSPVFSEEVLLGDDIIRFSPTVAKYFQVVLEEFSVNNSKNQYGITCIKVYTTESEGLHTTPHQNLSDLQTWLLNIACEFCPPILMSRVISANQEVACLHSSALSALQHLALAVGSLSGCLKLCDYLLPESSATSASFPDEAKSTVAECFSSLSSFAATEMARVTETDNEGGGSGGETMSVITTAAFDPSAMASGLELSNSNRTVRSVTGSNTHALLNIGFTRGKAIWEWTLDKDTSSQCSCFGVAIKPVNNSSYEYSTDLWMYRAYNGNQYARGRNKGSTKKIFKGDTVRCELDMDAGTLRFIINGDDQGVVFDDLAGFEIFPAVAFYSSDREISFVKLEAPGGKGPEQSSLCSLPPRKPRVGYGTLGLDGQLGYDSKKATVEDKPLSRAISLHPPSADGSDGATESKVETELKESKSDDGECASVQFDLNQKYHRLTGAVAINDDVAADKLGSPVTFEILCDDELLWRSEPVAGPRQVQQFAVSVLSKRSVELRTRCAGSAKWAHAVWIDPILLHWHDWRCGRCSFRNEMSVFDCALCGSSYGTVQELPAVENAATRSAVAAGLLQYLGVLADVYMREMVGPARGAFVMFSQRVAPVIDSAETESPLDLESPFSIEAGNKDTFSLIQHLMGKLLCTLESESGESAAAAETCLVALLRIVKANLRRLVVSRIDPEELGLTLSPEGVVESKRPVREREEKGETNDGCMGRILELLEQCSTNAKLSPKVQSEATDAIEAGVVLLFPQLDKRKERVSAGLSRCGVLEFHLSWPFPSSKEDGSFERAMLLLQLYCRDQGWKSRILGHWPACLHLVMELPNDKNPGQFLKAQRFSKLMNVAGISTWRFPDGFPNFPIKVEPHIEWDRKQRLAYEPGKGWIRAYTRGTDSFDRVVQSIKGFLPQRK